MNKLTTYHVTIIMWIIILAAGSVADIFSPAAASLVWIGLVLYVSINAIKTKQQSGCQHNNLGAIDSGFQYCKDCGMAYPVPQQPCQHHIYEIISEIETANNNRSTADAIRDINDISAITYINRCEKCGRIEKVEIKITDNG